MTTGPRASWPVYVLGALATGAIVAAILVVGPASGSQATVTRTATAAQGVVQSTVSGSGNLQAASQLNLGFKTSGTVTHIYVTQGEQVAEGQLLATLDPQSAEVTLEQSKAALQSAEANLAKEEEADGETSAGTGSGGSTGSGGTGSGSTGSGGSGASASAATVTPASSATIADVADTAPTQHTSPDAQPTTPGASTTPSATPPAPTTTTPASTPTSPTSTSPHNTTSATPTTTTSERATNAHEREASETKSSSSATTTVSAATREANLASARAAVKSDKLTVQSDEQAVQDTKLYAPEDGTIVSLSGQVGEVVSASGTTRAASGASSSSGSGSSAAGASGASGAGRSATGASSAAGGSSGSSGSGSSSSAFAILSDLSSMQLVVPLSESEIGNVRDGQTATVTVEALKGAKLAAHVGEVAILSTSNSGVVSYDVTFALDQMESGLKPGMSATAEVVVKQAEGVNVPTSAISGGSVTVLRDGKQERRRVVTGLAGDSSTIILSGLRTGEKVLLPTATSSTGANSLTSRLGSRLGGGGLGGGGGFPGGGGIFFRGGG